MQRISGFLGANPIGSLLLAGSLLLTACESKPATSAAPAAVAVPTDSTQSVVAAAYVCPMGCEGSASNSPGKCPVCDMALEHNPEYKEPVAK